MFLGVKCFVAKKCGLELYCTPFWRITRFLCIFKGTELEILHTRSYAPKMCLL